MTEDYIIYIPTVGRVGNQITLNYLPDKFKDNAHLVCYEREREALEKAHPEMAGRLMTRPIGVKGIAQTRKWLIESCQHDKIIMLDDDIRWCIREPGRHDKLRQQNGQNDPELITLLDEVIGQLDNYAHLGISVREVNNKEPEDWRENYRAVHFLAYQTKTLRDNCILGRIEQREDFDYTLQLLGKGFKNAVCFKFCMRHDVHNGFLGEKGARGGISYYRTIQNSNESARKLAELHPPGIVKLREKKYKMVTSKDATTGENRLEVTCYWKTCWKNSQKNQIFV